MIKFIELAGEYEFKWEFQEAGRWGSGYNRCTLKGNELVDWLQQYGVTPNKMFKDCNLYQYSMRDMKCAEIEKYDLFKRADRWAEDNEDIVNKNPWTCIGMNGGYAILSNNDKTQTIELGSAAAPANINIDNHNNTNVSPNIKVAAQSSVF